MKHKTVMIIMKSINAQRVGSAKMSLGRGVMIIPQDKFRKAFVSPQKVFSAYFGWSLDQGPEPVLFITLVCGLQSNFFLVQQKFELWVFTEDLKMSSKEDKLISKSFAKYGAGWMQQSWCSRKEMAQLHWNDFRFLLKELFWKAWV